MFAHTFYNTCRSALFRKEICKHDISAFESTFGRDILRFYKTLLVNKGEEARRIKMYFKNVMYKHSLIHDTVYLQI